MGGQNSQDSVLERRSLVWNDNEIEDGTEPDNFFEGLECRGKFFPRGCRGMIEELQLYCIGDDTDTVTLRYSAHPCLGPFGEVTITPGDDWAWQPFVIEEMWDYDSLFIWVHDCDAEVDWAYDAELPHDGHSSPCCAHTEKIPCEAAGCYWDGTVCRPGGTWADMAIRPFIRVVYTGETPGDVPVSGIINNIPLPHASSEERVLEFAATGAWDLVHTIEGSGFCDLMYARVSHASGGLLQLRVLCDGVQAFEEMAQNLTAFGIDMNTPGISAFSPIGSGTILLTKKFEFRRIMQIYINAPALSLVRVIAIPNLIR